MRDFGGRVREREEKRRQGGEGARAESKKQSAQKREAIACSFCARSVIADTVIASFASFAVHAAVPSLWRWVGMTPASPAQRINI